MTATGIPALLEPIQERLNAANPEAWVRRTISQYNDVYMVRTGISGLEFIAASPTDTARLLAAVKAVTALHKPEKRWLPHRDADRSYDTAEKAALDLGHTFTIDPSNMPYFEVCAHCKTVEDGPCDGECTREAGYRESLWPCPTVSAVEAALRGEA